MVAGFICWLTPTVPDTGVLSTICGKEKLLSIGVFPDVTLAEARDKRNEAKRVLAAGDDPSEVKQAAREAKNLAVNNSFELLALNGMNIRSRIGPLVTPTTFLNICEKTYFRISKKAITDIKPMTMCPC